MAKISVKQLGGGVIGSIQVEADGTWSVEAQTPQMATALRDLVARITAHPIPLIGGHEEKDASGKRFVTVRKLCHKGDPDYARALADALRKHTLLGARIRGSVLRESN
jgi:hypothetical protein